ETTAASISHDGTIDLGSGSGKDEGGIVEVFGAIRLAKPVEMGRRFLGWARIKADESDASACFQKRRRLATPDAAAADHDHQPASHLQEQGIHALLLPPSPPQRGRGE